MVKTRGLGRCWSGLVLGFIIVAALSGCVGGRSGITIVDLETGRRQVRMVPGRFGELPIDVDAAGRTFRTIQRSQTNSLLLRTVDFQGNTRAEKVFPMPDSAVESYGATWAYSVSPEGGELAYLDGASHELRVFDFASKSARTIASGFGGASVQAAFLFWIDNARVALGAHDAGDVEHDRILIANCRTATAEFIASPVALDIFQNALSASRRFLAYREGIRRSSLEGQFVLYDLAERTPVGVVKSMNGQWLSQPCWNLQENCLAYGEGSRRIMMYAVPDRTAYVVAEAPTNQLARLYGFAGREVLYKTYPRMGNPIDEPLRIRDVYSAKERQIPGVRINGPAFLVDNGRLLIAKTGF